MYNNITLLNYIKYILTSMENYIHDLSYSNFDYYDFNNNINFFDHNIININDDHIYIYTLIDCILFDIKVYINKI
jgi:hypothetical protein